MRSSEIERFNTHRFLDFDLAVFPELGVSELALELELAMVSDIEVRGNVRNPSSVPLLDWPELLVPLLVKAESNSATPQPTVAPE